MKLKPSNGNKDFYFPLFNRREGNKVQDYFPPVHTFLINKLIEKKMNTFMRIT